MKSEFIITLTEFRQKLHQYPQISGEETATIDLIHDFLSRHIDTKITCIVSNTGLICEFDSGVEGPVIVVRADVDALPINESSQKSHQSTYPGKAHSCGHDGHSAILCGLAIKLYEKPISKGKVILLFQPSEENGEGAQKVLDDPYFKSLQIDQIVALHNIPGAELGCVLWKYGVMCAASTGVIVTIKGETGHAAHPELGNSPINTVKNLISAFNNLPKQVTGPGFGLRLTVAGIQSGGPNFGVSPGEALMWLTMRTLDQAVLDEACQKLEATVATQTKKAGLKHQIEYTEYFNVTENDENLISGFQKRLKDDQINEMELTDPFSWSEDFGRFTSKFPGFLFGLGAGIDCKPLHHSAYDFPDELIPHGIKAFDTYIRNYLS